MVVRARGPEEVAYPESDGRPMGENTVQVKWIVALYCGLDALFRDRPDVFVAADLFWYPVRGRPDVVTAPDVMVAVGRPKGDRSSYQQWLEADTPPQAVFEVRSPANSDADLAAKLDFYRRHGAREYYLYDPDRHALSVWAQAGRRRLAPVARPDGFVSPALGVRFVAPGDRPMAVLGPDGKPFRTHLELVADADAAQQRADQAAREMAKVKREAVQARQQAADEARRADEAARRADALAAKLRALGIDPNGV